MKKWPLFHGETIGEFLLALTIAMGTLLLLALGYFYLYLPATTSHGEEVAVPDFAGIASSRLDSAFAASGFRYEISDSSYNEAFGPLEVVRQYPEAGAMVKPDRKIFISINRTEPPSVPVPAVIDLSLTNARVVLTSNGLKLGRIRTQPGPFHELVVQMAINGYPVKAGVRVPKGTSIELTVTDGEGANDFPVGSLLGMTYQGARSMIENWNLFLGQVQVLPGVDTTGTNAYVYRQLPAAGDSVRIGQPIHLWIGPQGHALIGDSSNVRN